MRVYILYRSSMWPNGRRDDVLGVYAKRQTAERQELMRIRRANKVNNKYHTYSVIAERVR